MALRTLCLSTETSSQDESEGSNVYLPTDGLIKDAMMSENRKNPVVNLLDVNGGRKQFLVRHVSLRIISHYNVQFVVPDSRNFQYGKLNNLT